MSNSDKPSSLMVLTGVSTSSDPVTAANELYDSIYQPNIEICIIYCSPKYDLDALGQELNRLFGNVNVIGATTSGEITPIGYLRDSITGVSIAGEGVKVTTRRLDDLDQFKLSDGADYSASVIDSFTRQHGISPVPENTFGFLLIDGLCRKEEIVVSSINRNIRGISLVGGSSADYEQFVETLLFHDGKFRSNCALFSLIQTDHPFQTFKTQHFVSSETRLVVTEADPEKRIVTEINSFPAGHEYARMVGLKINKLSPQIFSAYPLIVKIGGDYFVRTIQKVNDDESLTFACAIDEGIVLSVAESRDMVENLSDKFTQVVSHIGKPLLTLGCDCVFRYLEMEAKGLSDEISKIMKDNNVIGFSTYGEQYNAVHINQTFTGVAIGHKPND